ncbi:MAG: ABC transporter ATP-binding protein/permease [Clostridium sp.]|nr:ABC transporter ATP-binding protein/permease [Clostridium sp.]MDY5896435.1 ABC transporter ATP-binding protein [Oscillospiraceae bacterium]
MSRIKAKKGTLKKVLHYVGRYKPHLAFSIILAAVSVAATLYIPVLAGRAIDNIVDERNVDFTALKPLLIGIGILAAVTALAQWIMNALNNKITFCVVRDIRNAAMRRIQILPLSYIDSHPAGETVSRIIADADQFADGLLMGFTQLFTGVITILGTIGFMLSINVKITLVVVLLTPLSLFVARFIARRTYSMFRAQSETRGEQTAFIEEKIGSQKVVKAFTREAKTLEEFDEINDRYAKRSLKAIFFSSITNPSTRFVNSVVYAAVGLTGALFAVKGAISVGGLTCFLSYANQYTKPFNEISGVVAELQNALACAERLFELVEQPPQSPDKADAVTLTDAKGNVAMQNVAFSYVKDRELIKNLNLNVKAGSRIAIVGPTGCGKTTLINLLMRFYDVDGGVIAVDGIDINDITRSSLRRSYGMVLQDTWLKDGTVRENIAMGKPDATDEEIIAAAKASHAHSFIKRMPQGYNTVISDENSGLSQGQKQLLCIARVMLCLPPMLILDEATSSIDTRTEIKIQQAFSRMMQGRTSFVVAHRLSTIKNSDLILVMKDGSIIEQGTHAELMEQNGFYAALYNSRLDRGA